MEQMNKKRVVVFGATGTVGAYLMMDLLEHDFLLYAVGHRPSDNGFFAQYGIPYYSVDLANPQSFSVLPDGNIDAVVHLAGAIPARMQGYYPQRYIDTIMTGTINVLDYCVRVGVKRFIFAQSIADVAYLYNSQTPIPADAAMSFPKNDDHSIYSICKTAAVHMAQHYEAKYGIKAFILRFPNIYLYHPNPLYYVDGQERWQSYRYLIERAKRGEQIELWGNPNKVRDIVYVKDCIQIIRKALLSEAAGGIYNVGTGIGTSMREQIEGIIQVFSPSDKRSAIIECPQKADSVEYIMDVSKTTQELGYMPQYDYLSYLRDMKKEMEMQRFALLWGKDLSNIVR